MSNTDLTRRDFLTIGATAGAALALSWRIPAAAGAIEEAPRPAGPGPRARLRSHRNLFNGDCNFLFYNPEFWQPPGTPYRAETIHRYIRFMAANGVDTLLVNPNTQKVWYPSKRLELTLGGYERGDRDFLRRITTGNPGLTPRQAEQFIDQLAPLYDRYLDLIEAKVDWLAEAALACRQSGISPWLSYRMNDTHFSGRPDNPFNCLLFQEAKYRLSGRIPDAAGSIRSSWIGLNYAHREVRDYMLGMIREGIEAYDYEGLELDWLRHPVCLEAAASPRQIQMMTDWFAEVSALARARRPEFPVGLRIPANLAYLKTIGIDVRSLARRGVIDFLTFSNFWQTAWEMPFDALRREVGPEVVLYGGMEDAPNWLEARAPALTERPAYQALQLAGDNVAAAGKSGGGSERVRGTRYLSASAEFVRANAAGKLALGVEGLEQFNFFVTDQVRVPGQRADYAALRGLADLTSLRGREKHYALNTASVQPEKIWDQPEQLPVRLPPGHRRQFRLPMCAEPPGSGLRLIVQVVTERTGEMSAIGVSFNGAWPVFDRRETDELLFPAGPYTRHVDEHAAYNYLLPVEAIRDGWNEIVIDNESPEELAVVALELGVKRSLAAETGSPP